MICPANAAYMEDKLQPKLKKKRKKKKERKKERNKQTKRPLVILRRTGVNTKMEPK